MEAETKIVNGAYRLDTQGDIELVCRGDGATVQAESGQVTLTGAEAVNLTCADALVAVAKGLPQSANVKAIVGPLGKITLNSGPPVLGPRIEMDATSITLAIGPPVGGVSIKLDVEKITLQVGLNTFKMTFMGIDEQVGVTTRSVGFEGHSLEAAETQVQVQVQGINNQAPLMKEKIAALWDMSTTLSKEEVAGLNKEVFGIDMRN